MPTTIFGSVRQLVHDASAALIDHQITHKMADLATSSLKAGFDIVDEVLVVVRDLTKEQEEKRKQR